MRRILVVFSITAAVMLFIFSSADWYATNAALPRYCEDPVGSIEIVHEILTTPNPPRYRGIGLPSHGMLARWF